MSKPCRVMRVYEKIASMIRESGGRLSNDVNIGKRQRLSFEFRKPDAAWNVYNELLAARPKRHLLGLPLLRPHAYVEMEVEKDRLTDIVLGTRVNVLGHTDVGRNFVKMLRHEQAPKARR